MQFFRTLGLIVSFFANFPPLIKRAPCIKFSLLTFCTTRVKISHVFYESDKYLWTDLWTILKEQFPVLRNTAASKVDKSVIALVWQLRCHCNPDHNKFSSLIQPGDVVLFIIKLGRDWPWKTVSSHLKVVLIWSKTIRRASSAHHKSFFLENCTNTRDQI